MSGTFLQFIGSHCPVGLGIMIILIIRHIFKIGAEQAANAPVADDQYRLIGILFLQIIQKTKNTVCHIHHGFSAAGITIAEMALIL